MFQEGQTRSEEHPPLQIPAPKADSKADSNTSGNTVCREIAQPDIKTKIPEPEAKTTPPPSSIEIPRDLPSLNANST